MSSRSNNRTGGSPATIWDLCSAHLRWEQRVRGTTPGTFQRTFHTTLEESGTRAADRLKASTGGSAHDTGSAGAL